MLLGPAFLSGNHIEVLRNGNQIFSSMLAAIRSAQKCITFETYIYWSGDIGRELDSWVKVTDVVLHGADYFPMLATAGTSCAQMFSSSLKRRQREHAANVSVGGYCRVALY